MRGGDVDTTTSRQRRDNHGGGEGEGDGDGDRKCCATAITGLGERPPRSLRLKLWLRSAAMAAALVLAAEAVTKLKADDANGGDNGITIVGCACLLAGGGLIN